MPDAALTEVQAADRLGFRRWRDFARALRVGAIPRPDVTLPDGPRWSQTRLDRWLAGDPSPATLDAEEQEAIRRAVG
jgi:hypothetical protein